MKTRIAASRFCGRTSASNGTPPTVTPVSQRSGGVFSTGCENATATRVCAAIVTFDRASRFLRSSGGAKPMLGTTLTGSATITARACSEPAVLITSTTERVVSTRTTRVDSFTGTLACRRATSRTDAALEPLLHLVGRAVQQLEEGELLELVARLDHPARDRAAAPSRAAP